jgi:hypothetical protein
MIICMRSIAVKWMKRYCGWYLAELRIRSSWMWMRSSLLWMRSSRVVRAPDCQCQSRNSPGFDPSILRHSGIWGAADEAACVEKCVHQKIKENLLLMIIWSFISQTASLRLDLKPLFLINSGGFNKALFFVRLESYRLNYCTVNIAIHF